MNKRGINIAGSMLVDYVKKIDVYAQKGMLCNISDISKSVGGCVPNTLCDLAALDDTLPLKCIGMIGRDEDGRYLKNELKRRKIDISDVKETDDSYTSFTDVMTEEKGGDRTFFQARGANRLLTAGDIPYDRLYEGIFHIGYALLLDELDAEDEYYGTVMARVLHRIQKKGIATSMDVVSEEGDRFAKIDTPSLKYLNYLIINEIEAGKITGLVIRGCLQKIDDEALWAAGEKILDLGVRDWVIIHAPEGAWAMNNKRQYYYCPSLSLPSDYIKGSVGAGDAFCAGMLLSLYQKRSMEEALKIANTAAAANLSAIDSVSGMKSLAEVQQLYMQYGLRK